ncbi:MAG: sigma 54-interacting transcriptional regulator [Stappiaceae bacterium]
MATSGAETVSTTDEKAEKADIDANFLAAILLRSSFDRQPEAALIVNPFTGGVLHANRAARDIFNRADERMAGLTVDQLYPNARGELHAFTDEVLYRGHACSRDLKLFGANGHTLNVEHAGVVGSAPTGDFIIITILDLNRINRRTISDDANSYHRKGIGEWQRIQRYFRDLERENDLILSAAGEGIYGIDLQGLTTFLNPAAESMLGYSAEELVGKEMHATIHHHHADGSVHEVEICPIYNAFKQGVVNNIEDDVFWRKDGKPIRVQYTSTPILDSGVVVGAVIVFRDITERKRDEEKLNAALEENARLRERLELENAYLQEEILSHSNHREILGTSNVVHQVLKQIDLVAPTEANVLITGESGTGKELVARAIHQASGRSDRPLIRVNCAAIPRELFESEFFGHIKGAFTGAIRDRVGRFELADGGTLFLDEVGEIPIDLQSKLLRVLQDQRFERVGEERTRSVDVRVIAATNRDLKTEVKKGNFREDLYFRLNVFPIDCRPLRERLDDIPILAQHFLEMCCTRMNVKRALLTNANIADLKSYDWPGNARELQNVVEHAAILARHGRLSFNLPKPLPDAKCGSDMTVEKSSEAVLTANQLVQLEEANLRRALAMTRGRVSGEDGAAALLEMKPTTLYSRLKKLDLSAKLTTK